MQPPAGVKERIPSGIWALGFVSLLMDISSEMIHALLPVYLVTIMGASMETLGAIEGIAEATASIVKIFSGAFSDWLGKRKLIVACGYGLSAFTKPLFPLAPSLGWVVAARFLDRAGKGIRGAPRDALLADLAPETIRGAAFGLRKSLDLTGSFAGPLLAILLMWLMSNRFRAVFWVAVIPALLSFGLIALGVREPKHTAPPRKAHFPLSRAALARLRPHYWLVVTVSTVFTLAQFSTAFIILRAKAEGLPLALIPLVLVAMNSVSALAALPAGILSDRVNRISVLLFGFAMLIAADLALAFSTGLGGVALGIVLWGLHLGFTQGLLPTLVADTTAPQFRGTAYGLFNLAAGLALLAASLAAGALWQLLGPRATFLAGALFTLLALLGLAGMRLLAPNLGRLR